MPYKIVKSRWGCRVKTPRGRYLSRKAIPCDRAAKQARLVRAIEHGWVPTRRRQTIKKGRI